jgi:predicted nucleic acid-binding Zn ribbon protein
MPPRKFQQRSGGEKGPEVLGEVLARLFTARGWGRRQERMYLEEAWNEAAGSQVGEHTRLGALRKGVLEVMVDNAVLMQELAQFQKRRLLEQLRTRLPDVIFTDLRFRASVWKKI